MSPSDESLAFARFVQPHPRFHSPSFPTSHTVNHSTNIRPPRTSFKRPLPLSSSLKPCPSPQKKLHHLPIIPSNFHQTPDYPLSDPTTFYYNVKLNSLARKRHSLSRCLRIFNQMRRDNVIPDKYTYSALLKSCTRSNAPNAAIRIYHDIRKQGIPLDYHLRSSLLKTAAMAPTPQLDLCLRLFQGVERPNLVLCNVMMDAYASAGIVDQCISVFRYMSGAGILPDHYSVSSIIKAHVKANCIDDAVRNLTEMKNTGLNIPSSAVSSVISAYGKNGQLSKALEFYYLTSSWGIPSNKVTFNVLIRACAHVGDTQRAIEFFDEMRISARITPNRYTFHALIQCYLAAGDGRGALNMYQQICLTPFRPNQVSFRLAFQAVGQVSDQRSLRNIVEDMQQAGIQPREDVLAMLVASCIICSDLDGALKFFKQYTIPMHKSKNSFESYTRRFFIQVRECLKVHKNYKPESLIPLSSSELYSAVDDLEFSILQTAV